MDITDKSQVDILWLVVCSGMVFLMQAGFLCLETGLTRSKNNINVASKNICDLGISALTFWIVGYALMFGTSKLGVIGSSGFIPNVDEKNIWFSTFLLFQFMYCGTAVTILSGAVAERMRFASYIAITIIVSMVIYPIFGHWVWNGIDQGCMNGWLGKRGFVDFAGSTVIHSVGGWVALAALLVIGPRTGKFSDSGIVERIPAANIPSAVLGVIILWFGWFGFTGGSTFAVNDHVPKILFNTLIGGAAGMVTVIVLNWLAKRHFDIILIMNGALAGLVAITANCHAVNTHEAAIIGAVGGIVMLGVDRLLLYFKIDDAVSAVPVHLGAGIWGTFAVGLFGNAEILGTGLTVLNQTFVQAIGILTCFIWSFFTALILLKIINFYYPLRVSTDDENIGLNISEHGERSELIELFSVMKQQEKTGDLSLRVPVEPFTEVGQIAALYNQVMVALEHAVAKTEAIVESAMDGIIMFSKNNLLISTANPCAETTFGYRFTDIKGKPITEIVCFNNATAADTSKGALKSFLEQVVAEKSCRELTGKRADGQLFPIDASFAEATVDSDVYYTGTFRDITDHKQTLASLNKAMEAADAAFRAKSEFLANMSHEYRTPLNGILGYAQILRDDKSLSDQQRKAVKIIESSGNHLLNLINDVLDASKIEAGEIELDLQVFNFNEFLNEFVSLFQLRCDQKGLDFILSSDDSLPTYILADEKKLRQILLNLLSNAVKFSNVGSVTLDVRRLNHTSHRNSQLAVPPIQNTSASGDIRIRFSVADTGVGIEQDNLDEIFLAFRQVGDPRDAVGGTGLGLAISKSFVKLMGGDLQVKSTPSSGTTFWFDLDLSAAASPSVNDIGNTNNLLITGIISQNRKILIADDNEENRLVLTAMLEPSGFIIYEATGGIECIELAKSSQPDLILLDLIMPDLDGFETLTRIRTIRGLEHIPIIIVSANVDKDHQKNCVDAGCDAFVSKPVNRNELLIVVAEKMLLKLVTESQAVDPSVPASTRSRKAGPIVLPPENYTSDLIRYSQRGDINRILKTLDEIEKLDTKYEPLVCKFRDLAKSFDDQQMLLILNRLKSP